jgi:hypothetical protein
MACDKQKDAVKTAQKKVEEIKKKILAGYGKVDLSRIKKLLAELDSAKDKYAQARLELSVCVHRLDAPTEVPDRAPDAPEKRRPIPPRPSPGPV